MARDAIELRLNQRDVQAILAAADPRLVEAELHTALEELSGVAYATAVGAAPTDLGALRGELTAEVRGLEGRVFFQHPQPYHLVMEEGRRPGARMPPPESLAGWARRHGMAGMEFVLARAIARRGIKGRFFLRAGREAVDRAIPGALRELGQRVARRWAR